MICLYCENDLSECNFLQTYFTCNNCDVGFLLDDDQILVRVFYKLPVIYQDEFIKDYLLESFPREDMIQLYYNHKLLIKNISWPFKNIKPNNVTELINKLKDLAVFS